MPAKATVYVPLMTFYKVIYRFSGREEAQIKKF
jgi:hypothetical protein